jgi:hypothetical protein
MIYIVLVVFPLISIGCGIATLFAVIKFVIDIQRDFRSGRERQ